MADDEPPQLEDLAQVIRGNRRVRQVQTAGTAHDALAKVTQGGYDAIFLGVRTPDLERLDLAKELTGFPNPPALVLVSSFDASAVAAFELHAVDYLMKPVASTRIDEALRRVEASAAPVADVVEGLQECQRGREQDVIAVRDLRSGEMRLVARTSILYVSAQGDYVRVHADSGRYRLRSSMSGVEQRFTGQGFLRVHRQYIANLARATDVRIGANGTAAMRFENGDEIPVSRRQAPELRRRLRM